MKTNNPFLIFALFTATTIYGCSADSSSDSADASPSGAISPAAIADDKPAPGKVCEEYEKYETCAENQCQAELTAFMECFETGGDNCKEKGYAAMDCAASCNAFFADCGRSYVECDCAPEDENCGDVCQAAFSACAGTGECENGGNNNASRDCEVVFENNCGETKDMYQEVEGCDTSSGDNPDAPCEHFSVVEDGQTYSVGSYSEENGVELVLCDYADGGPSNCSYQPRGFSCDEEPALILLCGNN